jgi:hypothetical protein
MTKRKAAAIKSNPFLKLFDKLVVKSITHTYTTHTEWEKFENDTKAYKVFESWYNNNHTRYNHIKHAFNSLCKYHNNLTFTKFNIKVQNEIITSFWTFKYNTLKSWTYQDLEGEFNLVAKLDNDEFEIMDENFSSYKFILKKCI